MQTKGQLQAFMPHQYDKEAAYLSKMAAAGWHFCGGRAPYYKFEKGAPEDVVYQLDFVQEEQQDQSYVQLFADAGWRLVYKMPYAKGCWYYYCKKATHTAADAIYTDGESKLTMIRRVQKIYTFWTLFPLLFFLYPISNTVQGLSGQDGTHTTVSLVFLGLLLAGMGFMIYVQIGLIRVKRELEKQIKNGGK